MTDTRSQLKILADALTDVIDLAGDGANMLAGELVERVADRAATALMAARNLRAIVAAVPAATGPGEPWHTLRGTIYCRLCIGKLVPSCSQSAV
jgi:hypothetical protein